MRAHLPAASKVIVWVSGSRSLHLFADLDGAQVLLQDHPVPLTIPDASSLHRVDNVSHPPPKTCSDWDPVLIACPPYPVPPVYQGLEDQEARESPSKT